MQPSKPTSVLVMGIFHLLVGGLGIVGDVCSAGGTAAQSFTQGLQVAEQKKLQEDMEKRMESLPYMTAYKYGGLAVSGFLGVLLIVAGIGLLMTRMWGRSLSLAYAWLSIISKIGIAYYTISFLTPAMVEGMKATFEEVEKVQPKKTPQQVQAEAAARDMVFKILPVAMNSSPFCMMIYPIAVLLVLGRRSVRESINAYNLFKDRSGQEMPDDLDTR